MGSLNERIRQLVEDLRAFADELEKLPASLARAQAEVPATNPTAAPATDIERMPFGKYRGTPIADLDNPYLEWLTSWMEQRRFPEEGIRARIAAELAARRKIGKYIEGRKRSRMGYGHPPSDYDFDNNEYGDYDDTDVPY